VECPMVAVRLSHLGGDFVFKYAHGKLLAAPVVGRSVSEMETDTPQTLK
jgi:hypothetical protein